MIDPLEFIRRCHALTERGLSPEVATELSQAGNEQLLTQLEAASDEDLVRLSEQQPRGPMTVRELVAELAMGPTDDFDRPASEVLHRRSLHVSEMKPARKDRHDVRPASFIAGEDILAGAILGVDPDTGHLVMVGHIEPPTVSRRLCDPGPPSSTHAHDCGVHTCWRPTCCTPRRPDCNPETS